ncbi:hypothetical protein GCM10023169_01890 [Georgenia halophila]|uniref:Sulfotransferase family protein n=1 Tax=Georgenia halophila TaxID=620889 RepID=A0ABP8KT60_9MICO
MDAKPLVRPAYATGRRLALTAVHRFRSSLNHDPRLAHQGIQRAGTNYLCALLVEAGYFVENAVDPRRDDPRHKHFRWQDDKSTIVMDRAFLNDERAQTIEQVNSAANFLPGIRHVVIFKHPDNWLPSIHRWARRNRWIEPRATFGDNRDALRVWLREWDAYYGKWFDLATTSPGKVLVTSYEDLSESPVDTLARVRRFMGDERPLTLRSGGRLAKVPHSSAVDRSGRTDPAPWLSELIDETVGCRWRAYTSTAL